MISQMKRIFPVEQNRIICLERDSPLCDRSLIFVIRLQKLFPSQEPASPPPLTELEKLPTITNYQQASTTLSPTPKVEGKTFANFANFNFCLTFNFLRVQPGRSRGLGSPRNNTEHREPKKYYSTVAGASRFRNFVEQQNIYHEKSSIF